MKRIAMLFPGQGSHFRGMGKELYEQFPVARKVFDEANDVLGFDLAGKCFEGRISELNLPDIMTLSILTTSYASYKVWISETGVFPEICAGHSIGEFSALTAAGVLSFEDSLRIVKLRADLAKAVADSQRGAMTIVDNFSKEQLEKLCDGLSDSECFAEISCVNSGKQFAVSGHQSVLMELEKEVMKFNGNTTPLLMSPPFHCSMMTSVREELREKLSSCKLNPPEFSVISDFTARPYRSESEVPELLSLQVCSRVRWDEALRYIADTDVDAMIDIGPSSVVSTLIRENGNGHIPVFSFAVAGERDHIKEMCRNSFADMSNFINLCIKETINCKNNNSNAKEYSQAVDYINELIQLKCTNNDTITDTVDKALDLCSQIFELKSLDHRVITGKVNKLRSMAEKLGNIV